MKIEMISKSFIDFSNTRIIMSWIVSKIELMHIFKNFDFKYIRKSKERSFWKLKRTKKQKPTAN